jgi:hypothetical protein
MITGWYRASPSAASDAAASKEKTNG